MFSNLGHKIAKEERCKSFLFLRARAGLTWLVLSFWPEMITFCAHCGLKCGHLGFKLVQLLWISFPTPLPHSQSNTLKKVTKYGDLYSSNFILSIRWLNISKIRVQLSSNQFTSFCKKCPTFCHNMSKKLQNENLTSKKKKGSNVTNLTWQCSSAWSHSLVTTINKSMTTTWQPHKSHMTTT
jgi:hypothetical protein